VERIEARKLQQQRTPLSLSFNSTLASLSHPRKFRFHSFTPTEVTNLTSALGKPELLEKLGYSNAAGQISERHFYRCVALRHRPGSFHPSHLFVNGLVFSETRSRLEKIRHVSIATELTPANRGNKSPAQ
jgi:hypothetical protein